MKYIDAEKLIAEIKRRLRSIENCPFISAELGVEQKVAGETNAYKDILRFIDSLLDEPKRDCSLAVDEDLQNQVDLLEQEEELEEEIDREVMKLHTAPCYDELYDYARHFAEWGAEHLAKQS